MNARLLLGVPDAELAREITTLVSEGGAGEVVGTARDADELVTAFGRAEIDAVLLHEDLGPLPVLELSRELSARYPAITFLLIARDPTAELLRLALRAGVRDVLSQPLTVEAIAEALGSAIEWSEAMRERMGPESNGHGQGDLVGGRIITLAGAKGGTGTTTVALHLALAAAGADPDRSVCLVELDLQAGDLRAHLDLPPRRSIVDLLAVAEDVSPRSLEETLYVDGSGLRVLLAPDHGEDAEEVSAAAVRQILGALKFQFDLVVVDMGSVVTEPGAVAVELAHSTLIIATPDVPALRGANRLVRMWERLHLRGDAISVVLNRTHRSTEIQPDLARQVSMRPVRKVTIPAGFRELEPALNTGVPQRVNGGSVAKAIRILAEDVGAAPRRGGPRRLRMRAQAGQVAVETLGLTAIVGLVALALWQVVLTGYTFVLAGDAARAGARDLAVGDSIEAPARRDLPGAWRSSMHIAHGSDWVRVTLRVPLVVPGLSSPIAVSQRERTVVEDRPLPAVLTR